MNTDQTAVSTTVKETIKFPTEIISISIPQTTKKDVVMRELERSCNGLKRANQIAGHLWHSIGSMLLVIKRQKYFQPEYDKFETFLREHLESLGVGRTVAWKMMRSVEVFGNYLNEKQFREIPKTNLDVAAAVVKRKNIEDPKEVRVILQRAATWRSDKFKATYKESHGNAGHEVIRIVVDHSLKTRWERFIADRDPADVIKRLMSISPRRLQRAAA